MNRDRRASDKWDNIQRRAQQKSEQEMLGSFDMWGIASGVQKPKTVRLYSKADDITPRQRKKQERLARIESEKIELITLHEREQLGYGGW